MCYQSPINVTLLYFSKSGLLCCKLPPTSLNSLGLLLSFLDRIIWWTRVFFLLLQPSVDTAGQHWPWSWSSAIHLLGILLWTGLSMFFAAVCLVESSPHVWGMLKSWPFLFLSPGKLQLYTQMYTSNLCNAVYIYHPCLPL